LAQYRQAPQVTRRRLYLEAMTGFLSDMKGLYIVDRDQKAMVPWLPLASDAQPAPQGRQP
jgi:membrane protease subunit HflK